MLNAMLPQRRATYRRAEITGLSRFVKRKEGSLRFSFDFLEVFKHKNLMYSNRQFTNNLLSKDTAHLVNDVSLILVRPSDKAPLECKMHRAPILEESKTAMQDPQTTESLWQWQSEEIPLESKGKCECLFAFRLYLENAENDTYYLPIGDTIKERELQFNVLIV